MKARLVYLGAGCLALGLVLWLACGERIVGEKEGVQGAGEVSGGGKVSGRLVVPDSVPVVVDEAALARAFELRCSGIRILRLVKPDERADEETYYVTFFEDGCGKGGWDVREHRVFAYHRSSKGVTSAPCGEIGDMTLAKTAQYFCWHLAEVFKDAYHGGDFFRFSQSTEGPGAFHKVIWDLQSSATGCDGPYPGGFNDCISSHKWDFDCWGSYCSYPKWLQVWKHANRQGPSHKFEGWPARWDNNWSDEYWGLPPESINDKVSSIDMFYEVK
ncbi:MAG: hypothetical protein ONB15_04220 [candidate division KSB1 bacterium]|nr:hypothetical protein [candidate division KSB1 bacterium]